MQLSRLQSRIPPGQLRSILQCNHLKLNCHVKRLICPLMSLQDVKECVRMLTLQGGSGGGLLLRSDSGIALRNFENSSRASKALKKSKSRRTAVVVELRVDLNSRSSEATPGSVQRTVGPQHQVPHCQHVHWTPVSLVQALQA